MRSKKWLSVVVAALVGSLAFAAATSAQAGLEDGDYTLTLPGITDAFMFTIDSEDSNGDGETVVALAAPVDYVVDDDDPNKAAWKTTASLEVEVKLDKVEADVDWASGATLALPGGGNITVTWDGESFTVTASFGWYAFGSGNDWYVADNRDLTAEGAAIFKVEADEYGIELKAVDAADEGFLNDLDDDADDDEEVEVESEDDGEGKAKGKDKGRGGGNGA